MELRRDKYRLEKQPFKQQIKHLRIKIRDEFDSYKRIAENFLNANKGLVSH